ncbi:glyoxylase-like metal-dependent hydrolase (beta-lactamase superfamily II) [Paenibacillus taihuensis]|uniref:Glyoxylase-like metal-dependent hydrolase (Beta-lactamase superfamily II) n=2 Tax=Paenibacillus taihuensis TaxID=1156355 RepID=A0A3D9QTY9_9BACL|nr:glyoxylase-like metal-dependent hydrolase (beta-lactamase superfamily II) [Paenibacillus taihuensis]
MTAMGTQKVTAKELTTIILNKEDLFILDVRNESDFSDWKIEGISVDIINIPYFDLLDDIAPALDAIPADKPVVVVCAKEGSSIFVAEQLAEAGLNHVSYLEGGMKSWSEYLEPVKVADLSGGGELYQFVRIGKGCLSYMVLSNGEAALIDTSRMIDQYQRFMQKKGVELIHAIDTHLHADHISGGRALAQRYGAAYHLPPKDATEVTFEYEKLVEGRDITVGQETIKVQPIYTPGHTIGSTSFLIDNTYILTGDILFIDSIGRPDLAGLAEDWVGDLRDTLYSRYKVLSEELIVLPAHFGKVTELGIGGLVAGRLGTLYSENPGLNIEDESEFRRTVTENLPPQPNSYQEIRQVNMGKIAPNIEEQREMEIGPNRCAVHDK